MYGSGDKVKWIHIALSRETSKALMVPMSRCLSRANMDSPAGRVHYKDVAAEASYECERYLAIIL